MNILLVFPCFVFSVRKIRNLSKKPKNNVYFYLTRDKGDYLYLHVGKPFRDSIEFSNSSDLFFRLRSKDNDYVNLKLEDEPIEVFLNMEN